MAVRACIIQGGRASAPIGTSLADKEYVVKADLPDVKKEMVKVGIEGGVLTVHMPKTAFTKPRTVDVKVA